MKSGPTAALAAPSVTESDGYFLRPDMIPLGPTLQIPRYENAAAGDLIVLGWIGGPSDDGQWTDERVLATADEACVFNVPFAVLMASDRHDVTLQYVLRRFGTDVDEPSPTSTFTVQDYTSFVPIRVVDPTGQQIAILDHEAQWFDASLRDDVAQSLTEGDEVVIYIRSAVTHVASTMVRKSALWRMPVTAANEGAPVSHRFGREFIAANYGETLYVHGAIIRKNGYIQYPTEDMELPVSHAAEILPAIIADQMANDRLILDDMAPGTGLDVSLVNQAGLTDISVRFYLDESSTEPFQAGIDGPEVKGSISREMLERHADGDCYLYGVAAQTDADGAEVIVGRSVRRHVTIRHRRGFEPLPPEDPSLPPASIDGLPAGPLEPGEYPGGPLVRVPIDPTIAVGDTLTMVFSVPDGLAAWTDATRIDAGNMDADLVRLVPMWFLSYAQNRAASLYYTIETPGGGTRYSPVNTIQVGVLVPRLLYAYACKMKEAETGFDVIETAPDTRLMVGIQNELTHHVAGDLLVVTLLGDSVGTSATLPMTLETTPTAWIYIDIPQELIEGNAGSTLRYRSTKVRRGYIDHTPFKYLSILSAGLRTDSSP